MLIQKDTAAADGILYAFYDLAAAPNTFDVFVFLILAEIERRETECEAFHLYVVRGPNCGLRADADVTNLARQQYMLGNVVLGSRALMPTCSGVTLCSTREYVERLLHVEAMYGNGSRLVFPPGYSVHFPLRHYFLCQLAERWERGAEIPGLQPTDYGLTLVDRFLRSCCGDRKVVTVTLREASVQPERNSNLGEWGRFVATLDPNAYAVLILRDLEKINEPLPPALARCLPYPEAVVSIELRAALYHRAYLNLCVSNGPAEILKLDPQTRYLIFKTMTEGVSCTSVEHHRKYQWLNPGDQIHFATPFQRLVWEDDRAEVLAREFTSMVNLIEGGRYATRAAIDGYLRERRERWIELYPGGWRETAGGAAG